MFNPLPWYVALMESVPEAFLILMLGFAVFNYPLRARDALLIAMLSAAFSYYLHKLPLVFGVHTVIGIVFLALFSYLIGKKELIKSSIAVLAGLTTLIILEALIVPISFYFTGTGPEILIQRPWTNIAFFIPQGLTMAFMYVLIKKKRIYIWDFSMRQDDFEES